MSSQGSSSAKAVPRTAFGPLSGDPLSRDVSTSSTSSTESAPEVASSRVVVEAAGPEREAVSISERRVDDGVEEVAVSCGDLVSLIMSEECARIAQMYGL